MKHLLLFEGFKDDTIKQMKDAKNSYKNLMKKLKSDYVNELEICMSDLGDNYNVMKDKDTDNDTGLKYYRWEMYCELDKLDEFKEDILSTCSKVFSHLGSDVEITFMYYHYNPDITYPEEYELIFDYTGDNIKELEREFKSARKLIKQELQKSETRYKNNNININLWDVVNNKPFPSPTFKDLHEIRGEFHDEYFTPTSKKADYPFMFYIEIFAG